MNKQSDYYRKLWTLADQGRSTGRSGEVLLDRLQTDFTGKRELFSGQEYSDPAFREVLLGVITRSGDGYYIAGEVIRCVGVDSWAGKGIVAILRHRGVSS
jgi:hypothetical protein